MVSKKKLYRFGPKKKKELSVEIQNTKRERKIIAVNEQSAERDFREVLARKSSGTHAGLWLLIPEYLRLGSWDLIKGFIDEQNDNSIKAKMALQLVNESALCSNRIRQKNALCSQGFSLVNGLSFLATDEAIHHLLDQQNVSQSMNTQIALAQIRRLKGHYHSRAILAIDPHRIISSTKRKMSKKKKRPEEPSHKMLQTFFCNDTITGQPIGFTIGSSGRTCSSATKNLLDMLRQSGFNKALLLTDKEHFTREILELIAQNEDFDIVVPAPGIKRITDTFEKLNYIRKWPGYALAETKYKLKQSDYTFRLLVQRNGEASDQYSYKPFLTTSDQPADKLLPDDFPRRWSIEEFFNFEGDMGWNRASTFNLNIRYGKQTLALIAQAATYQLKKRLPRPFKQWTARHTAEQLFLSMEGDVRVKDDTIIVTYYSDYETLGLVNYYQNLSTKLQAEGINPRIPWLYNYKLDFRFK